VSATPNAPPSVAEATPARDVTRISQQQALPRRLRHVLALNDFEEAARRYLPRPIFAYVSGGVEDNRSLHDNRVAFDELGFIPRFLVDVSKRSQTTTLFGRAYSAPFGIAPMGIMALSAYRGDLVVARTAAEAEIPMIMSGSSLIRLEEVAQEGKSAWFQAYLPGDVSRIEALIERVARAGFDTLVITLDTPVAANRENNVRAGFSTPLKPSMHLAWDGITHPGWLFGTFLRTLIRHGMPHFENSYATRGAPILSASVLRDFSDRGHLNWQHFKLIRRIWKGRLIAKGILDTEDARLALECGVDGIIVSNHGGRQLDGSVSPLRVLPEIAAVCREIPVMMDSGIRRGTDVLKALALGAKFVFVGRPFNYAAAIGGKTGVRHAINILSVEIDRDMAMLGINSLAEIDPKRLIRFAKWSPPQSERRWRRTRLAVIVSAAARRPTKECT
jgi:L-lactate dehydrogenase (cytochrome)